MTRARDKMIEIYRHPVPLGTWPDVELEEESLQAEEIGGSWMPIQQ